MRHKHLTGCARTLPSRHAALFFLALGAALLTRASPSLGEDWGGTAKRGLPSAYTWTPEAAYGVSALGEDPVWAGYAARGQAFEGCPEAALSDEEFYREQPVQKRRGMQRKNPARSVKRQAAAKPAPKQSPDKANPCPPIIMPIPALPLVCPDPGPGSKK